MPPYVTFVEPLFKKSTLTDLYCILHPNSEEEMALQALLLLLF